MEAAGESLDVVLWLEFRSVNFTAEVMNVGNLTSVYFEQQRIAAVVERAPAYKCGSDPYMVGLGYVDWCLAVQGRG